MDIYVQGDNFENIGLIENYESCIWTERYSGFGDFDLKLEASKEHRSLLAQAAYLRIPSSKKTMICETTLTKNGTIAMLGRSLESILEQRVVETAGSTPFTSLTNYVKRLVMHNAGGLASPTERQIENFWFYDYPLDGFVDSQSYDGVPYGENLYTAVKSLCDSVGLGFEITNDMGYRTIDFKFTYGKTLETRRDELIFSEAIGNIQNVSQMLSKVPYKNVAVVNLPPWDGSVGLGELWRVHAGATVEIPKGLKRRETWTDASELRRDDSFTVTNKPDRARAWGYRELRNHPSINETDFELAKKNTYKYGVDYNLGDQVKVISADGNPVTYQVTEYIQSFGPEGDTEYPTLTAV